MPRKHSARIAGRWIGLLLLGSSASLAAAFALAGLAGQAGAGLLFWKLLPVLILARAGFAVALGLHRQLWRYAGMRDLWRMAFAQTFATGLSVAVILPWLGASELAPLMLIDWMTSLLGLFFLRAIGRLHHERPERPFSGTRRPLVIVGAGDAGEAVVRELIRDIQSEFDPVAFIDNDPRKHGLRIHGLPVAGGLSQLQTCCEEFGAEAILIAIAGTVEESILAATRETGLPVKRIPALAELVAGRAAITELRELRLEDLLRRDPIAPDTRALARLVEGKRILVTGAAGSIGSELSRQLHALNPATLVLLDMNENALFTVEHELKAKGGTVVPRTVLASVRDEARVDLLFREEKPQLVFHAAAYKHVPVLEHFPEEAVRNNVRGTRNIAYAADLHGAERVVLISTDKAVRPTSVMGASKRAAELLVAELAQRSSVAYTTIRFGNVLGSNGSVLQLFREQVAQGGPITVTHPDMKRYFMSIPEAVGLVLSAAAMAEDGGTFILDMGEQLKILDLARHFIRMCGLEPGRDIPIEFVGLRPGEKLYEELWVDEEDPQPTAHPSVLRAPRPGLELVDVAAKIQTLIEWADEGDRMQTIEHLRVLVPDYSGTPIGLEEISAPELEKHELVRELMRSAG